MNGTFACCPIVCAECATEALQIQRKRHHSEWGDAIELIDNQQQRECVREFLRGIYQRAKEAHKAREAA